MGLSPAINSTVDYHLLSEAVAPDIADEGLEALRNHALFKIFEHEDLEQITRQMRRVRLDNHELLYRQDTDAQHFFFVVSGRLRLYRLDYSGYERTLDSLGPGDCFAEVMIYAKPARYACYAESLKHSEVLMIPIQVYRDILRRRPDYAENALTHYAKRAVSRFHDLEIMTVQSARERLVRYILDLLPANASPDEEIELPLPKCLVASRLAMQPETFSRLLNELKSSGLVKVNRNRLLIPDPSRLLQISR